MLKKRIIPCLDIKEGRIVKGIHFLSLRDAGDPVEQAGKYAEEGADELVFLDITATNEKRKTLVDLVKRIAHEIDIPFTVGGGIGSLESAAEVIGAGADKVSVNSAAVRNPQLIREITANYGSQFLVLAMDVKQVGKEWKVFVNGGREETNRKAIEWAKEAEDLGAGEILLTSMDHDGTGKGFAIDITNQISKAVSLPVIASGGAGNKEHFAEVLTQTQATGALAAGIFHFGDLSIQELKTYLKGQHIEIR